MERIIIMIIVIVIRRIQRNCFISTDNQRQERTIAIVITIMIFMRSVSRFRISVQKMFTANLCLFFCYPLFRFRFFESPLLLLMMPLPLVPTAVTVAAPAANVDGKDDGDSNFTNTSGSLRSKK